MKELELLLELLEEGGNIFDIFVKKLVLRVSMNNEIEVCFAVNRKGGMEVGSR